VTVVPDERLNAIVVYANRTDRTTIEGLLKVLDSAEVPEALGAERLTLIPIKNTDAQRIASILRDLYKNQADGISVEDKTNSLVVTAPPALVEELRQVADRLDEAAGSESSRSVRVVPLEKTSSQRMQRALNILLHEPPRRRPR
jgi:type II secretory pathway component GspD/PulD (secretin)